MVKSIEILILNTDITTHGENYLIYILDLHSIRGKEELWDWVRLRVTC